MTKIWALAMALALVLGFSIGAELYVDQDRLDFYAVGQYEPEMVLLGHDEMMAKCEKYDLVYNYEEAICQLPE